MSTVPPHAEPPAPTPAASSHDALAPGTRFGEFEIIRVLGVGGFGIVYLARDHSLERDIALKEYMPASLASRGVGPQITIRSSSYAETYAIGLRSFVNEARLLARFDHASLVKVYRFWEDNATAYMVMPYLQGITLRDARRAMTHAPDEAWVRSVIDPIMSALELLHREGVYHRDIAPDNILLPPEAAPVLLDFGAARRVISDRTQSLTAILKPSYAPIEQYAEMTQLRQGPWTDLYALAAVMHYLLFGVPPAPATARAVQEDSESVADRSVPGVSPRMLEAIAWALAIRPNQRPQSVDEFRAALDGRVPIPVLGRQSITLPGSLAPLAGRAAAPTPRTDHEPTLRVESITTPPTQTETAYVPTASQGAPPAGEDVAALRNGEPSVTSAMPGPVSMPQGARSVMQPAFAPTASSAQVTTAPNGTSPSSRTGSAQDARTAMPGTRAAVAPPSSAKLGLVLAGIAVFVVAAGALVWQFGMKGSAVVAAEPAASAATASVQATAVEPPAAPAAVVAPSVTPALAPAVAVVAAPSSLAPASSLATPPPLSDAKVEKSNDPAIKSPVPPSAAKVAAADAALPASVAAASRPKTSSRSRSADLAAAPNGAAEPSPYPAPQVAETRTRSSASHEPVAARPVVAAVPSGPKSAREACGSRVFIALAICMDRECEQPQFRNSTECVPILQVKRARENR
ncbi:MAG: protein kinase [Caldimonas sp.]